MESPRQLATPTERLERIAMLNSIRRSERSLYTFISKMAQNRKMAAPLSEGGLPTTHQFFVSLNNQISVRGQLTPKQKVAINATIDKYADYFMTLRVAKAAPIVVQQASDEDEALVEQDAPLDESMALDDEREGMVEA